MYRIHIFLTIILLSFTQINYAQRIKTDANLVGHMVCSLCGEHIPFANVSVKGTTIGNTTDQTGHYQLINLPEGTLIIKAHSLGYKPQEKEITIKAGETKELNFELEPDVLGLEEVVITGDRNETNRIESSTIVNTITPKILEIDIFKELNYICNRMHTQHLIYNAKPVTGHSHPS